MAVREGFEQRIDAYNSAYGASSEDWFNYFSQDATVYAIGEAKPVAGRRAYEEAFRDLLREPRQVEVLSRDLQLTDDTAVVMQLLSVTQAGVVTIFRESTIWRQEGGEWQIIHMNTSLAADPIPENIRDIAGDPDAIRVLGSRLATASAQVGIAQ